MYACTVVALLLSNSILVVDVCACMQECACDTTMPCGSGSHTFWRTLHARQRYFPDTWQDVTGSILLVRVQPSYCVMEPMLLSLSTSAPCMDFVQWATCSAKKSASRSHKIDPHEFGNEPQFKSWNVWLHFTRPDHLNHEFLKELRSQLYPNNILTPFYTPYIAIWQQYTNNIY